MKMKFMLLSGEKGYPSIEGIDAIVLETDGSLTVIKDINSQKNSSMQKVKNWSHKN